MKKSFLIPYLVWLGFSSRTPIHAVEKSRIAYEALKTSHEVRLTSTVKDEEGLVYTMVAAAPGLSSHNTMERVQVTLEIEQLIRGYLEFCAGDIGPHANNDGIKALVTFPITQNIQVLQTVLENLSGYDLANTKCSNGYAGMPIQDATFGHVKPFPLIYIPKIK